MLLPTETTRSDKVEGKTKNSGMDFISSDKDRLSKESMICSEARQAGIVSKDRMSTSECEMSLVKVAERNLRDADGQSNGLSLQV